MALFLTTVAERYETGVVLVALADAAALVVVLQVAATPPSEVAAQVLVVVVVVKVVVKVAAPIVLCLSLPRGLIKNHLFYFIPPLFYFCVALL